MKKRKNKAYLYIAFTLILMLGATFVVFNSGRTYKVKDAPVYGTDIDWYLLESGNFSVDSLISYVDKTGINTVILHLFKDNASVAEIDGMDYIFSANEEYKRYDFITQFKNKLSRKKVQLFIQIDCQYIAAENAPEFLTAITEKYKPSAIVLENCTYSADIVAQLKDNIHSASEKTELFLQEKRMSLKISDLFDGYIAEDMIADQYSFEKDKNPDSKLILHYTSDSVISDSFILTNFSDFDGAVAVHYMGEDTPDTYLNTALSKNENLEMFGFTVSDKFKVTYPTKDFTTYYSGVYVTGNGAKNMVEINGRQCYVQRDGTFAHYITLEEGENIITVTSDDTTYSYTVTKKSYKTSTVKYEKPWDETEYLAAGRVVKTTSQLTSMLSDPDDDSAIIAGLEADTKLIVTESVQTERNGYNTYAYKLSNGGHVLASKVEITNEVTQSYIPQEDEEISDFSRFVTSQITSASLEKLKNGDEQLYISASGKPAVVHTFTEEKLSLLFLDAEVDSITLPQSRFYTDYTVVQSEAGCVIELALNRNNPLWGYDIKADEGQFIVYLKQTPHLSSGDKPLENITVLLDAGHGGKDSGAVGVASINGPLEKDLNLAVAKATKTILQQYGATVYMTREDDSFPSLDDRRNMTRDLKPDLFIAVHHNSMDYSYNSSNAKGSECYYFTHQSENLAQLMCENITVATDRVNRGAFTGYYYVTRTDIAPSVLMEYSFIINPDDYTRTYTDKDIYKAAFGTAMAVLKAIPQ